MAKLLTEFIGTFFLVLTICLVILGGGAPTSVIAIGAALIAMIYMGGHISGAHYNPAVTLALCIAKKADWKDLLTYWVAQILGGVAGAFTVTSLLGKSAQLAPGFQVASTTALTVEILFTFALALVILNVATHKKMAGNHIYGLVIGFMVVAAAYAGGPISGGAFNPAVGIALTFQGSLEHLWVYLVGPFVGATLAALVFSVQERETAA